MVVNTADQDLLQIVKSYFAAIGINMSISDEWTLTLLNDFCPAGPSSSMTLCDMRQPGGITWFDLLSAQARLLSLRLEMATTTGLVNDPAYNAFVPAAQNATNTDQVKTVMTAANQYVAEQHFAVSLLQPML